MLEDAVNYAYDANCLVVAAAVYGAENIDRMKKGLAPQRYNPDKGAMESMELSHEPIPFRDGGRFCSEMATRPRSC